MIFFYKILSIKTKRKSPWLLTAAANEPLRVEEDQVHNEVETISHQLAFS